MPATYTYDPEAWKSLLELKGWTNQTVAKSCNFSTEHVANILNGVTKQARRDTKEKVRKGLEILGASKGEIEKLFA